MAKILVVDDEQDICEILQFNLQQEGYEVDIDNSAEDALMRNLTDYDLILLDVMMGDISGFKMARMMKQSARTANIPIIFITALDNEDSIVEGLEIGADDYITKPLPIREVKLRVKAVLRRSNNHTSASQTIAVDSLIIDLAKKEVRIDGTEVVLTRLEFELLVLFASNINRCLTRDFLIDKAWPSGTYVSERTVDVNITRLRKKIGCYGDSIKTKIGYGYIFEK